MWFMKSINWSVITALKTALAIVVWLAIGTAKATPIMDQVSGRVLHFGGTPVVDAQVSLFDLTNLRQGPVAQATTDGAGYFTLSLAGLQNQAVFPDGIGLGQNYPNPFNPATIIPYQLAEASHVRIEVFNVLGQLVATLVDAEQAAGSHIVRWDARDASGRGVAAGVYLYRFTVGDITQVRRMVLLDGKKTPAPIGGRQVEAVSGMVDGLPNPIYGLVISGQNMVSHVVSDFQLSDSFIPVDIVIDGVESEKSTKVVAQSGILGDADLDGQVNIVDALLVAVYSANPTAISISSDAHVDVNCDGQVDIVDAWLIGKYSINPNDPDVRRDAPNIGTSNICSPASLSPDPSTVTFDTNGTWHRFTIQSSERVIVVANPSGTTPLVEISASSGESNLCPPEQNDEITRNNGESIYLSGCGSGTGTVELRRASDNTVLNTYTFAIGVQASLSPDPSTVTFDTNGTWHRFTIQSSEPVIVVANPSGTTPLVEITDTSGEDNFCPPEQEDDYSGNNGESIYLSGCGSGTGTVELRRASDNTVLNTYTFAIGTDSHAPQPRGITYANNRFYEVDHDDDKVYVYNSSGQRDASADFNLDSNNGNPNGITYANNRFYVVDHNDDKVYVYNSSGQRVSSADFNLDSNNGNPEGITYANNRFYVVDWIDAKVYVYTSSGQRVSSADFNLDSNNGTATGITYANNRFYVVDYDDAKVYVYTSSGQRVSSADFNLDSNNGNPLGITYTNDRLYVADRDDDQIYSYDVSGGGGGGSPDLIVESPSVSDNTLTAGQSFTLQATVRNQGTGQSAATTLRYYQSANATISASDTRVGSGAVGSLNASSSSVESISLNAPSSAGTYYYGACVTSVSGESKTNNNCSVGVRVTVSSSGDDHGNSRSTATQVSSGSMTNGQISPVGDVDYFRVDVSGSGTLTAYTTGSTDTEGQLQDSSGNLLDSDDDTGDLNFRVSASVSAGTYYIRVIEHANNDTGSYTLHVSVTTSTPSSFNLDSNNGDAYGITYANNRFYVTDYWGDDKVYVYNSSGQRVSSADFNLDSDNTRPTGITYANNRFYVLDLDDDKVYVYNSSGQRVSSADFNLDSNNGDAFGITYANNRFYVTDYQDAKVYVYNSSGGRVSSADFNLDSNNGGPTGITYANNRLYVVDYGDDKVYVYNSSGGRVSSADFNLDSDNSNPTSMTYANNRFYVVDEGADKVYVYE